MVRRSLQRLFRCMDVPIPFPRSTRRRHRCGLVPPVETHATHEGEPSEMHEDKKETTGQPLDGKEVSA
jgi:hypothetical protein